MRNHRAHLAVAGFNGELYAVGGIGTILRFQRGKSLVEYELSIEDFLINSFRRSKGD
jgi:hypothetical protein